ncbi:MAG: Uma2 family endonuclease [Chloroflexota bacterium]|nr:Uma2 family endonuclease [Chloroflexota bacterium]MDQ6908541.1 Uma2 family endonuclease [Chloroflexota bacterium]
MAAPTLHRTFTVTEYERMIETGILSENERVELFGGELYRMSPIGARHVHAVNALNDLLWTMIGHAAIISVQNPIRLDDDSMPLPDLAALRRQNNTDTLPTPADVLLVIEVADSSLAYDRGIKFPRYAAAGIAEAWLIDLAAEIVERHSEPRDGLYRQITLARAGDTLTSAVFVELMIPISAVFSIGEAS